MIERERERERRQRKMSFCKGLNENVKANKEGGN